MTELSMTWKKNKVTQHIHLGTNENLVNEPLIKKKKQVREFSTTCLRHLHHKRFEIIASSSTLNPTYVTKESFHQTASFGLASKYLLYLSHTHCSHNTNVNFQKFLSCAVVC